MLKNDNIWCIAYINRDFIDRAEGEIQQYDYDEIEVYIPTVKILKKKFKGKDIYDFVPLLFNYGFFKIPYKDACNEEFLSVLRQRITCIYGWVKDPLTTIQNRPKLNVNNEETRIKAIPRAAVATDKEVATMVKAAKGMSIYSKEDLDQLTPGSFITLKGYPFENIPAEIIKINHKKQEIKVKLLLETIMREVTVSFENVFYTIYSNYNEEQKDKSLDDIEEKGNRNIDKIFHKITIDGK